ncbi:MAG: helix-turn-helix domain-containing protein, partial [Bacteroides fragilis]
IQRNADLYVWMPFAISSLKTEIAALIANREMIRKRYIRLALGGEASDPIDKEVESSEGDQEFIRQVRSLIEERMTDSGFKIGELSDCMNMSRSSFYNKIKEITGHAPADYVRNVRLNRALVLLMSRKYTVAEVADMTGFSDPKYFGIVFKKYYGGSPTKYINNL